MTQSPMDPEYAVHAVNCSFRPHIVRMAERLSEFVTLGTTIDDVDSWNTRADWVERFRAASEHYIADMAEWGMLAFPSSNISE